MTLDRAIGLVAALAGIVAAWAGIIAARYAKRGFKWGRDASEAQNQQRAKDITPRPVVKPGGTYYAGSPESEVWVANAGGADIQGLVAVRRGNGLYTGSLTLGAHTPAGLIDVHRSHTTADSVGFTVVVVLAQDIDGRWWDAMVGRRLDVTWASIDDSDCKEWMDQHIP